jgi:hypothetical protein
MARRALAVAAGALYSAFENLATCYPTRYPKPSYPS